MGIRIISVKCIILISDQTTASGPDPKNMVRTDAKEQKLEKFFTTNVDKEKEKKNLPEQNTSVPSADAVMKDAPVATTSANSSSNQNQTLKTRRDIKLSSVKHLRQLVNNSAHTGLKDLMANHSFVGCIDRQFALLQHQTKLFVVDTPTVSYHLFYLTNNK